MCLKVESRIEIRTDETCKVLRRGPTRSSRFGGRMEIILHDRGESRADSGTVGDLCVNGTLHTKYAV